MEDGSALLEVKESVSWTISRRREKVGESSRKCAPFLEVAGDVEESGFEIVHEIPFLCLGKCADCSRGRRGIRQFPV